MLHSHIFILAAALHGETCRCVNAAAIAAAGAIPLLVQLLGTGAAEGAAQCIRSAEGSHGKWSAANANLEAGRSLPLVQLLGTGAAVALCIRGPR
jgi:hypothetical protein